MSKVSVSLVLNISIKFAFFLKNLLFVKTERSTMIPLLNNFKALTTFSFPKLFRPDKSFHNILFLSRQKKKL